MASDAGCLLLLTWGAVLSLRARPVPDPLKMCPLDGHCLPRHAVYFRGRDKSGVSCRGPPIRSRREVFGLSRRSCVMYSSPACLFCLWGSLGSSRRGPLTFSCLLCHCPPLCLFSVVSGAFLRRSFCGELSLPSPRLLSTYVSTAARLICNRQR